MIICFLLKVNKKMCYQPPSPPSLPFLKPTTINSPPHARKLLLNNLTQKKAFECRKSLGHPKAL